MSKAPLYIAAAQTRAATVDRYRGGKNRAEGRPAGRATRGGGGGGAVVRAGVAKFTGRGGNEGAWAREPGDEAAKEMVRDFPPAMPPAPPAKMLHRPPKLNIQIENKLVVDMYAHVLQQQCS